MRTRTLPFTLPLLVAAAMLTVACLNLDDVAALTKTADLAQQTLPLVVKDWPDSCARVNALVQNIPAAERPPTMVPQDCAPYRAVARHLVKDEAILIAYFDALGKLSSNTLFTFDKKIDSDVKAIDKLPGLSDKIAGAATAAEQIGKAVADAVTRGYRARKVNALIENTDDAVHQLTADLQDIVTRDYVLQLANESNALDAFYKSPIAAASSSERLALVLVQRQYSGDTAALAARKSAAENYGRVMNNMAALHAKLKADVVRKASLAEIAAGLGPYVSDVQDAIGAIRQEIQ
jgi:hypothetical protein